MDVSDIRPFLACLEAGKGRRGPGGGGGCTCVKMEPFVLLAFSRVLQYFSRQKVFPVKRSVFGVSEGPFGPKRRGGSLK